jgi:hypothetical protein
VITASLGLPMWIDLIVEYVAGFAFGLFIFQSLFMKSMMGGTYWENVGKVFVPEFVSMNFMMAGMAPVMSFLMMGRDMRAMEPTELLFWGVMSIGVIAGHPRLSIQRLDGRPSPQARLDDRTEARAGGGSGASRRCGA